MNNPAYRERKPARNPWLPDLPAHWGEKRLKYHGQLQVSNVDKKSVEGDQEVSLCNYMDVYKNERITKGLDFMRATASTSQIARFSLRPGDLLFTKDSEDPRDIAVPSVVVEELENVVCGYHLAMLRPEDEADGRFLGWAMRCPAFANHFQVEAKGVTRFGLDSKAIGGCWLPSPDLEERKAIANYLDRETAKIDALIEEKRKLLGLLEDKRKAVINRAVTKGLDPNVRMKDSGVPWLGEIPVHWAVKRLKYLGNVQTSNVDKKSLEGQTRVRLCNYTDVYKNERIIVDMDFMIATATEAQIKRFELRKGDVLFTKDSEDPSDIAVPAIVMESLEGVLCGYHLAMFRPTDEIIGKFVGWGLNAKAVNSQFIVEAKGVTRFGLDKKALNNPLIPTPPEQEMRQIVDYLERYALQCEQATQALLEAISDFTIRRTALITAAVTGQMDVRGEADRETTQNGNFTFDSDAIRGKRCT